MTDIAEVEGGVLATRDHHGPPPCLPNCPYMVSAQKLSLAPGPYKPPARERQTAPTRQRVFREEQRSVRDATWFPHNTPQDLTERSNPPLLSNGLKPPYAFSW